VLVKPVTSSYVPCESSRHLESSPSVGPPDALNSVEQLVLRVDG
jgi:hypothetical protein